MNQQHAYPKQITPTKRVVKRIDVNGRTYLSFRAMVANTGGTGVERTVRAFGPLAGTALKSLKKGVTLSTRVLFESFEGADGKRGQTLRIVSIG